MSMTTTGWVVIPNAGRFPWPPADFKVLSPTTGTVTNVFNEGYYPRPGLPDGEYRCHQTARGGKSTWGHTGVDIAPGTQIQPGLPGWWQVGGDVGSRVNLMASDTDSEMGNWAIIAHSQLSTGILIYTFYAHLASKPRAPQTLWVTDTFAYAGSSGSAGTGMHLHFEIRGRVADLVEYRSIRIKQFKAPDRIEHQMRCSYNFDNIPRPWSNAVNEDCRLYVNPQNPAVNRAGQHMPIWSSALENR